jgi:hypothetical protein
MPSGITIPYTIRFMISLLPRGPCVEGGDRDVKVVLAEKRWVVATNKLRHVPSESNPCVLLRTNSKVFSIVHCGGPYATSTGIPTSMTSCIVASTIVSANIRDDPPHAREERCQSHRHTRVTA